MTRSPDASAAAPATGGLARWFVENPAAAWVVMLAVLAWGAVSFRALPQQEDPALPGRLARLVCIWPGASAAEIEERVTRPLEDRIQALDSMQDVGSESRASVSVITLGQRPAPPATIAQEWDRLRASLAQADLPDGCQPPRLMTEFGDVITLLLAVTGPQDAGYRPLANAAARLREELQSLPEVGRVQLIGDMPDTIELTAAPADLKSRGLSLRQAGESLTRLGRPLPGAVIGDAETSTPVRLEAGPATEADLRALVVGATPEGAPMRLDSVFSVRRGDPIPLPFTADVLRRPPEGLLARQRAIMVAVEMRAGQVIGRFDREVRDAVRRIAPQLPAGMAITTVSDQPLSVRTRLDRFGRCFAEAVAVILIVALLLMEWRAALIVAAAIPLTVALTLGGMAAAGIPLHQVSIAALIIALGMLVDDPVVAADGINREMAAGTPRAVAAWLGPWKLRRPIFFATLVNIFAFLPLLLLPGDKKSFIHALPVVVTLSLIASRIVSMTFVPLLGRHLLRGQPGFESGAARRRFPLGLVDGLLALLLRPYRAALATALRHPWPVLAVVYGLLAASLTLAPRLGRQFFPPAERSQFLVDIALPEGSSLARTRRVCDEVLRLLAPHPQITGGAVFMGGSGPRFYYNVTPKAPADHLAQFLLTTRREEDVPQLVLDLRAAIDREITEARCVVRRLEQGPPVEAPIQIRLTGPDRDALRPLADQVSSAVRHAGGYKVNDTLGAPIPGIRVTLDPTRAQRLGIDAATLAAAVQAAGPGLELFPLQEQVRPVPVRLRLVQPDGQPFTALDDLPLEAADGSLVPLNAVADVQGDTRFAALRRHGGRPAVTVEAHAPGGELPASVLDRARPALDRLALPPGCRLSYEGEARELVESRREMAVVMAVSLGLIALTLVVQFRSVARSVVVLATVPLGLIGALVGLTLWQVPMGFMAMLACVSLAGVIVSHILVLSDAVEEARAEGLGIRDALVSAGLSRLRPVLVTTLATAGGLAPLALTGGALWQPLTAVHITGLLVATVLTLIVLPVWYALVVRPARLPA